MSEIVQEKEFQNEEIPIGNLKATDELPVGNVEKKSKKKINKKPKKKNIVAKDENNNTSDAKEKDDDDSGDQNPQATDQLPTENNGNRLEVSGSDKEKKNKNQNQEGAAGSCASGQADASRIPNTRRKLFPGNNHLFNCSTPPNTDQDTPVAIEPYKRLSELIRDFNRQHEDEEEDEDKELSEELPEISLRSKKGKKTLAQICHQWLKRGEELTFTNQKGGLTHQIAVALRVPNAIARLSVLQNSYRRFVKNHREANDDIWRKIDVRRKSGKKNNK